MTRQTEKFILAVMLFGLSTLVQAGGPPPGLINKGVCSGNLVLTVIQSNIAFGSFGVTTGGTITINPNSSRTATAGIDPVLTSPTTAISVSVDNTRAGCEIYPVRVIFPAPTTIDEAGGTTMTLQNFVSNPPTGFTLVPGTPVTVTIGADLLPVAGQLAGAYTSAIPFLVNIRY